jgi:hypothetical protein
MNLLSLQHDMRAWLASGTEDAAAAFAETAQPGLGIYQNNYRAQLVGCLEDSFAVTLAWLGAEAFRAAVVTHIERAPPSSWTLDHYARGFPATLAELYPADLEVADLGNLELALAEAFVAPDSTPLQGDLASIDWDRARFEFTKSLAVHPLSSNAPAIWSAIAADQRPPRPIALEARAALLVWRSDETCRFRAIDEKEHVALLFMMASAATGSTFGQLCASQVYECEDIGLWLRQWLADKLITRIYANRETCREAV